MTDFDKTWSINKTVRRCDEEMEAIYYQSIVYEKYLASLTDEYEENRIQVDKGANIMGGQGTQFMDHTFL